MKLYFSPGACSLSPHIVLAESGLDYAIERVQLATKQTAGGADFTAINPKGYVPALVLDDGSVLTEGPAIVQYVADQAPAAQLAPAAGTLARYRLIEWLNFIATELHKSFSPLFGATSDDAKANARAAIARRLPVVAKALAGQDYLLGAQFSAADAYLFTVLSWTDPVQVPLTDWPSLQAFRARVAARPGVQRALREEVLLK